MREIALDTETTGLNRNRGDKLVEIGCVELVNGRPTGRTFHCYINPLYPMSDGAFAVHGISNDFLQDKPVFAKQAQDFLNFIGDAKLVIHNAPFDIGFLNKELQEAGHPPIKMSRVIDTQKIARQKFPGQPVNLDALCRRFGIDNSKRHFHGALIDAQLLARVYQALKNFQPPKPSQGTPRP